MTDPGVPQRVGVRHERAVETVIGLLLGHQHETIGGQRPRLVLFVDAGASASRLRHTKCAMHCARLGSQGIELLTTRRLELPIGGEPRVDSRTL